jgi:hypothetical protein
MPAAADDGGRRGLVVWAGQACQMDAVSYRVWRACGLAPSLEQLVDWAESEGIVDPHEIVDLLTARRLLTQHSGSDLGALVLRFAGEGLGEGAAAHTVRLQGVRGDRVDVTTTILGALVAVDQDAPLAERCAALDGAAGTPPGHHQEAVCEALPALVRTGVVRLDQGPV